MASSKFSYAGVLKASAPKQAFKLDAEYHSVALWTGDTATVVYSEVKNQYTITYDDGKRSFVASPDFPVKRLIGILCMCDNNSIEKGEIKYHHFCENADDKIINLSIDKLRGDYSLTVSLH